MLSPTPATSWGSHSPWLIASISCEVLAVGILIATVGEVGSALYAATPINWALVGLALAALACIRSAGGLFAAHFGATLAVHYRRRSLHSVVSASPDRVRDLGPGAALMKALDVEGIGDFLARASTGWILGLVEIGSVVVLLILLGLPPGVGAVVVISMGLGIGLTVALIRARRRWRSARAAVTTRTMEGLLGVETTRTFREPLISGIEVDESIANYRRHSANLDALATVLTAVPTATLGVLIIATWAARAELGLEGLAAAVGVALLAASGLQRLVSAAIETSAVIDASWGLTDLGRSVRPGGDQSSLGYRQEIGEIYASDGTVLLAASHVTASFEDDRGLIDPVSLVVREGDRVVISAPSGFGKTTLGELLSADRTPTTGWIWKRPGAVVARVLQSDDDHMFANSVLFNAVAGVEWPPGPAVEERALALLNEVGLGELIASMPAGVAQPIGEGGWRLSSGERSRLSTVAALLRSPDVLILDESVATLDAEARDLVLAACTRHSKATIMFAHWD